MPRQKLLIPFGGGLDRKSGSAVVEPDSFPDLRNVYVARGRMELRKGHDRILDIAWGTDIIGIIPMRANGLSAVIVYDSVSRNVRLYIVDSTPTATLVGTMWTIPVAAAAVGVPRM